MRSNSHPCIKWGHFTRQERNNNTFFYFYRNLSIKQWITGVVRQLKPQLFSTSAWNSDESWTKRATSERFRACRIWSSISPNWIGDLWNNLGYFKDVDVGKTLQAEHLPCKENTRMGAGWTESSFQAELIGKMKNRDKAKPLDPPIPNCTYLYSVLTWGLQ